MKRPIKVLFATAAFSAMVILAAPNVNAEYYNSPGIAANSATNVVGARADTTIPSEKAYKDNNQWKSNTDSSAKHKYKKSWKAKKDTADYKSKRVYKKANSQWKKSTSAKKDSI